MTVHPSDTHAYFRPPLDLTAFKAAMSRFASGVTIVTTVDDDGTAHGFTASSFCSASLDPPLVLVCLSRSANSFPVFTRCARFAISVLRDDHAELAARFARKDGDKFRRGRFVTGPHGLSLVHGALASLECVVQHRYDAGDHVILVGRVVHADFGPGRPAVYFNRSFGTLAPDETTS